MVFCQRLSCVGPFNQSSKTRERKKVNGRFRLCHVIYRQIHLKMFFSRRVVPLSVDEQVACCYGSERMPAEIFLLIYSAGCCFSLHLETEALLWLIKMVVGALPKEICFFNLAR